MAAKDDLNKIFKQIIDSTAELKSSRRLKDLGEYIITIIRNRTRQGKGVKRPGGNVTKLKALKASTIKKRKAVAALLHPMTSPGKSNLTYTGQLLDSMRVKVRKETVSIGPSGRRVNIYGRRDRVSNEQVTLYVSKERPFNHLGRAEMRKVVKYYQKAYDTIIRRRGLS